MEMDINILLMNGAAVCATAAVVVKIVLIEYESVRRVLQRIRRKHPRSNRKDGSLPSNKPNSGAG